MNTGYWLTPEGKLYEVGWCKHTDFAMNFLKKEMGEEELRKKVTGYRSYGDILHKRGWVRIETYSVEPFVRILGNCIDPTIIMRNTMCPPMNASQMRVAKMMCEENNTTLYKALNDKRFW